MVPVVEAAAETVGRGKGACFKTQRRESGFNTQFSGIKVNNVKDTNRRGGWLTAPAGGGLFPNEHGKHPPRISFLLMGCRECSNRCDCIEQAIGCSFYLVLRGSAHCVV
jgi:hypothetical protein